MKELPTITIVDLIRFDPCYRGERLTDLLEFAGTKSQWNALDILGCDAYSVSDRLWLVLRPRLLPANLLHKFGYQVAEISLTGYARRYQELKDHFHGVLEAKRNWIQAEDKSPEPLYAARDSFDDVNSCIAANYLSDLASSVGAVVYHLLSTDSRRASYAVLNNSHMYRSPKAVQILTTLIQEYVDA